MSRKACSRIWQAEAAFDGCLSRADGASFDRHAANCEDCTAERAVLLRLQALAERIPGLPDSPLRRRALHIEVLRRANELAVSPRRQWRAHPGVLVALVCAVAALFLALHLSGWPPSRTVSAEPSFDLAATPDSNWHVSQQGPWLRIALGRGTFSFAVHKLKQGQRFVLALPDGELEVRGTHFTVDVSEKETRRVAVRDGVVALRFAQQAELTLGAGETWPPASISNVPQTLPGNEPGTAGSAAVGIPPGPTTPPALRAPRATDPAPFLHGKTGGNPSSSANGVLTKRTVTADAPVSDAAEDFARAMAVFSHGDYGTAEPLLSAFEARFPHSAHNEDVLFLRALARSRRGDQAGARALAGEYVRLYPKGFRAEEARKMALGY